MLGWRLVCCKHLTSIVFKYKQHTLVILPQKNPPIAKFTATFIRVFDVSEAVPGFKRSPKKCCIAAVKELPSSE